MKKNYFISRNALKIIPLIIFFLGIDSMLYAQKDLADAIIFRDQDMDNVPDCWDQCLDTPMGSRVDGAGCALDMDLDGIIDLYDKCITEPGETQYQGCPESEYTNGVQQGAFTSIQFDAHSVEIHSAEIPTLKKNALLIKKLGSDNQYFIEGHANEFKEESKNIELSNERAKAVQQALIDLGVPINQIRIKAAGNSSPLYPECVDTAKCKREGNEWKNRANRRVDIRVLNENADSP